MSGVVLEKRVALKQILFTTDFSRVADAALPFAVAIARRYEGAIYVAHVLPSELWELPGTPGGDATREANRRVAQQQLHSLMESGAFQGVPHQARFGEGDIWEVLARIIREDRIDLVVMGTQGRTGLQRLLLGSVAEEIFRCAECPVLTVGPHAKARPGGEMFRDILYPTDFSEQAAAALPFALSLAEENDARLTLMHVVPADSGPGESQERARAGYLKRLKEALPAEAQKWQRVDYDVRFGNAASGILATAAERDVDLIVLGVRRSGAFARAESHLRRSVAHKVVSHAQAPVLTVRS
jgi:nucleotide-binding universal stress UspA family protein